jgi:hypothetical protein
MEEAFAQAMRHAMIPAGGSGLRLRSTSREERTTLPGERSVVIATGSRLERPRRRFASVDKE